MKATTAILGLAAAMLASSAFAWEQPEITAVERITGLPPSAADLSAAPGQAVSGEAEISAFERITGTPAGEPVAHAAVKQPASVKVLDAVIVRPLGVAATVIGAGYFAVIAGPAALAEGHFPRDVAQAAVVKPFQFTFQRPLGDTHD